MSETENFMARWGVDTITPKVLREGKLRSELYDVWQSMTRYRILIVLMRGVIPNEVNKSI